MYRFVDAFGQPNADGVYLVRVIEFSDDPNEDGWTYASMMVSTALANAARDLGYPSDQVSVADSYDISQTDILPDGIKIHAYAYQVPRTKPCYRESRPPTGEELARWAGRRKT